MGPVALRESRGGQWVVKGEGDREENILGGELCTSKRELLKKMKALEAPNSEALYFSFKVTVGKWIVGKFVFS